MQDHEKYGQQVLQYETKRATIYLEMAGISILILAVFGIAVSMFLDPGFWQLPPADPISKYLPAGITLICLVWAFIIPRLPKLLRTEGAIYESGIVLSPEWGTWPNTRMLECSFDEITGIQQYIVRKYFLSFAPWGKHNAFIIHLKKQYTAYTGNNPIKTQQMNNIRYNFTGIYPDTFLIEFFHHYTNHLIKDLTIENIKQADLSFGKNLRLTEGQLIYRGSQVVLPLDEVSRVTDDRLPFMDSKINIRSINDRGEEKKTISIPITEVMNVDALYYIIYKLT